MRKTTPIAAGMSAVGDFTSAVAYPPTPIATKMAPTRSATFSILKITVLTPHIIRSLWATQSAQLQLVIGLSKFTGSG
jgi:hypothetical protein